MKIIGIHGRARSGKDTLASYFVTAGYRRYGFADPIKKSMALMLGWDERHTDGHLKEVVDPFYGFSPRQVFQLCGTEFGRKMLRDDLWIKIAEKFIAENGDVIIPDVRFDNEAEFILNNGGVLIHVVRPSQEVIELTSHVSEAGLRPDLESRAILVYNEGSLDLLEHKVGDILMRIEIEKELSKKSIG